MLKTNSRHFLLFTIIVSCLCSFLFIHCSSSDCPEVGGLSGEVLIYYSDRDGDGFTTDDFVEVCPGGTPPDGFRTNKSEENDCNDECENCHPGRSEICDREDNDCDAGVDEGLSPEECTPCNLYCADFMKNCTDDLSTYNNMDECLAACAHFPQDGEPLLDENSLACRASYAEQAEVDPEAFCPNAGITGAGVCGNVCEAYCQQVMGNCTEANAQYPSDAACRGACAELPQDGDFNAFSGDSIQCRTRHGSYPAALDPVLHCPHSGFSGAGVCGNR